MLRCRLSDEDLLFRRPQPLTLAALIRRSYAAQSVKIQASRSDTPRKKRRKRCLCFFRRGCRIAPYVIAVSHHTSNLLLRKQIPRLVPEQCQSDPHATRCQVVNLERLHSTGQKLLETAAPADHFQVPPRGLWRAVRPFAAGGFLG